MDKKERLPKKSIIKDLEDAITLLLNKSKQTSKARASKVAAQTLLGKVYLTLKDYTKARGQFNSVESSGEYRLLSTADISTIFSTQNELNDEIIFAVQFASGINANSEGSDAYRMFNPTGREEGKIKGTKGLGIIKKTFYDLYDARDARKDVYLKLLVNKENIEAF